MFSSIGDRTDVITDFQRNDANGKDVLNVHDVLSGISGVNAGHTNAVSGGYLTLENVAGNTNVWVDADGNAGAGGSVLLVTLTNATLTQSDTTNLVL